MYECIAINFAIWPTWKNFQYLKMEFPRDMVRSTCIQKLNTRNVACQVERWKFNPPQQQDYSTPQICYILQRSNHLGVYSAVCSPAPFLRESRLAGTINLTAFSDWVNIIFITIHKFSGIPMLKKTLSCWETSSIINGVIKLP